MAGFLFGGNTNLSYDELQQKRKVANALAAQLLGSTPNNTGEGIGAILKGIGVGVANSRTNSAENANRSAATELFNSIIGGTSSAPPTAAQGMQSSASTSGVNQEISANTPAVNISGDKETFVSSLLPAAIEESKRTGVDPRIIVAQAAQETGWGRSAPGNNYFGIKSHGQGGGNNLMTHEYVDGKRVNVKDSFRAFESPADSVRGYGDFILKNPRYEKLRTSQGLDAQLQALQESGYATDPNYSRSVGAIAKGITLPEVAYTQTPTNNAANAIEAVAPQQQGISNGSDYNSPMMTYDDKGARVERPYGGNNLPALPVREIAPTPQVAQVQDRQQAPPNTPSQQNGVDPRLYQALANPWLDDGQKASIQAVIQQQQQAADRQANEQTWRSRQEYERSLPENQLDLRIKQTQLEKLSNPGSDESYFGNPVAIQNPDGSVSYGQIGNRGGFKPIQLPEGASFAPPTRTVDAGTETILVDQAGNVISRTPKNNREAARETASGKVEGETTTERQLAASGDAQSAQNALALIENLRNDPAREQATGMSSILNNVPGTAGYDFNAKVEQAKSGAFLTAIQQMKGLGALSNAEGSAATAAITRMKSSLSEEGFLQALNEYETIVRQALQRASSRLPQGQMVPAQPQANKPVSEMTDEELRALANGG